MSTKQAKASPITILRQGDVALIRVAGLPSIALTERTRDKGAVVLAYGEVTGHSHAILDKQVVQFDAENAQDAAAQLLASVGLTVELHAANAPSFLEVKDGGTIEHQEHDPIALDPGTYVVLRQCEWTDDHEPIQVRD